MKGFKFFESIEDQIIAAGKMAWDILVDIEEFDRRLYAQSKEHQKQHPLNFQKHLLKDPDYWHAQDQIKELRTLRNHLASTHIMMGDINSAVGYLEQDKFSQARMEKLKELLDRYWKVINYQRPRHDLTTVGRDKQEDLKFVQDTEKEADHLVKHLQQLVLGSSTSP